MMTKTLTPEMEALKAKLKATWTAGDFGQIAKSYAPGAADFVSRLNLQAGERVLDVACGTGNLTIPAAKNGASVTGLDLAPNLLEQGRAWAKAEGLAIQFDENDAEALPYDDASFDTVISMFGAMFTPRPDVTAAELARACRPGGRIAMANWTPGGFIGQMFKIVGKHVPPAPGMPSPLLWGDEMAVRERFNGSIADLQLTRRSITFNFPFTPAEVVECFHRYYGPTYKAFGALDEKGQAALRQELEQLWLAHNQSNNGVTRVESEYLEVVAIRAA
ncbi:MAG: methyltransferase domain-containing protein [Anaerolineales bacterium]|nr:methyltransferase domain-containing protein [Anaerolineales bacterium]